jgi:putative spermidine/putrescine transport system ATP-binding protein
VVVTLPGSDAAHLVLRGIRKAFGRTVAVDGLDLAVAPGEFLALLGPSGCGKTTTLRIVAGFERPDAGEVWIRNTPVTAVPPYRRDIGLVFQSYALFPHLTVAENVAYGLRMRRVPAAERTRRVDEALALVRLSGLGDRYPRQLSGGQQQRVAVARAIVIRPSVLLFDEPLSNLDARLRLAMREELRELQRTLRIATVLVTHDQEEALSLADRIAVMNGGRVEQTGTPREIYERPASRFVTEFIGESNFLAGEIRKVEEPGAIFVADCGLTFRIATPPGGGPGRRGTIAIRPEAILLLAPGTPPVPGATVVDATVRTVTYLGAFRKYRVTTTGGRDLLVSRPLDPLDATARPLPEGALVRLAWLPWHCTFQATAAEPASRGSS